MVDGSGLPACTEREAEEEARRAVLSGVIR